MAKREYERLTEELITPVIQEHGFELWDVEWVREGTNWYLRVYIDKEGGITVDDCEVISRQFGDILDERDYIEENYIFEVSSPGLDRPLKKDRDFERSIGKDVELKLYRQVDKKKEYTGILTAWDKDTVTIEQQDGSTKCFERASIAMIRLAFFF